MKMKPWDGHLPSLDTLADLLADDRAFLDGLPVLIGREEL